MSGEYLNYTEYTLPVKVQSRPDEPMNIFIGTKFIGKMIHTDAVPNGRPSAYWVADDEGNATSQLLETRFDAAVGELLLANGYVNHVGAYLAFDRRHDAPPSVTAAYVLPDRNPEVEPSAVKFGLIGAVIAAVIVLAAYWTGRRFGLW